VDDSFWELVACSVLLFGTFTAAAIDVRKRRIPNKLCGALALAGIALHVPAGIVPTISAIAALLFALLIGFVIFSAGWLGGGDVKLIAACCALAGLPGSVRLVIEILIAGAFLSLLAAAWRGRLLPLLRSTFVFVRHGFTEGSAGTVPYGVAIAAGSCAYTLTALVPALRLSL
jgi:prepilin peptidase CpaA